MLHAIVLSIAIIITPTGTPYDPPPKPIPASQVSNPQDGMAGRYKDSNVYEVWKGATHEERQAWLCIRRHESYNPDPKFVHLNYHQSIHGGISTASGAGQWLDGTWRGIREWVKFKGEYVAKKYDRAMHAPAWVQDLVFRHVWKRHTITGIGMQMWYGTGCPRTG